MFRADASLSGLHYASSLNNLSDSKWPPKSLRNRERHANRGLKSWVQKQLRPVLGVDKEINPRMTSTLQYWLINYGRGAALDIEATYRGKSMERMGVSANILGPDTRTQFDVNTDRAQAKGLQILYRSEDGRRFATTVTINGNNFEAKTFQVDEKGGWLADPKLPGLTCD